MARGVAMILIVVFAAAIAASWGRPASLQAPAHAVALAPAPGPAPAPATAPATAPEATLTPAPAYEPPAPSVTPPAPTPSAEVLFDIRRPSKETCAACHSEVFAEWAPSLHHRAWTNDNILRETRNFEKTECRPCHSPQPVLPYDLELSHQRYRPPDFRPENVEDGVHCLSCHGVAGNDGVAARRDMPGAPCKPRKDERLSTVAFCSTCHDPTHQAAEEYWTSEAAFEGTTCADCHMERVERPAGRRGRSHVFPGGFSESQVRKSLAAEAHLEGRTVVLSLENRAGHKLPGEIPSRAVTVLFEAHDAAGARVLDRTEILRRPFKRPEEKLRPDDRLLPGETRTLRVPLPEAATKASVTIFFRSLPLQADRLSIPLGRFEMEVGK